MKRLINLAFILTSVITIVPQSAAALSAAQTDVFNLGIRYFNTESQDASDCSVNVGGDLSGNGPVQQAFNYFVSQGLSPAQAAGVVGNLRAESGVIPTQIQNPPGGNTNDPSSLTGNIGWGIAQWTPGNRVFDIAKQLGITGPIYELSTQLAMVMGEMKGTSPTGVQNMLSGLLTINDPRSAADYFEENFEAAKNGGNLPKREDFAQEIYDTYGGSAGTVTAAPSSGGSCNVSGPGQDTQFIDGFIVYSQYDPQWANDPYSTSTIGESGCGPTAMAMIITNLSGKQITPDVTAAYAASQGLYEPGVGSSWSIGKVLAEHWGLKATFIGSDMSKINAALQAGSLVITSGQGALPFTSGGHFIVIRGVTADGKWKVGDSAHTDTNTQSWDPQQLLSEMNSGSVYAISK